MSYGLLEMQFSSKIISINRSQLVEPEVYADVPIFKVEKIKKHTLIPKQKKLVVINPIPVDDKIIIKEAVENIITEPEPNDGPELTPEGVVDVVEIIEDTPQPFSSVQNVPIYPGCEKFPGNSKRRKCMSEKINKLINRKFDTGIVEELGLNGKHRIQVQFKIDKFGNVTEVKTRASHSRLEKEARKVVGKLPKMIPGRQNDKDVEVIFTLPIVVKAQN